MRPLLKIITFCGTLAIGTATLAENSGTINIVGSDTLEKLLHDWTEAFKTKNPTIAFTITAKGSSTAPPALISGAAHLAPMSRKMKKSEQNAFKDKFGYKAVGLQVAIDAVGVFVHKSNSVTGLTLEQLDAIYSSSRACGASEAVTDWGKVGGPAGQAITLLGRNDQSGTYAFFKKRALCKGDYNSAMKNLSSNGEIISLLDGTSNGIGYSGIGFTSNNTKIIPIAKKSGSDFVDPTNSEAVAKGKYPLSRFLYIYINKDPKGSLPKNQEAFLQYILSDNGQTVVKKLGFVPLTTKLLDKQHKHLK